jgi:predicted benzoate:H+ symporter BenE
MKSSRSALQDAFEKAFGGTLRLAALTAFVIAATPCAIAGITSAFRAIVAGMAAAFLVERPQLLAYWRNGSDVRRSSSGAGKT